MPFSIDQFNSKLNQVGGLARSNVFEVELLPTRVNGFPTVIQTQNSSLAGLEPRFFCQTVSLPSLNVESFLYRPNNIDMARSMPRVVGHGDLECVFMVDDQHKIAEFFHTWMRIIANYSDTPFGDQLPYELGYKTDYACNMIIRMYSRTPVNGRVGGTFYQCQLFDVYPVQVGSITLEWAINDSYMTLPVTFSYSNIDMKRYTDGIVVDNALDTTI
jgi:hypothetical protein